MVYEELKEYFEYPDERNTRELLEDIRGSELEKDHGRIEPREIRTDGSIVKHSC